MHNYRYTDIVVRVYSVQVQNESKIHKIQTSCRVFPGSFLPEVTHILQLFEGPEIILHSNQPWTWVDRGMSSAESRLSQISPRGSILKKCIDLRRWRIGLGVDAILALHVKRCPKGRARSRQITASVYACVVALTVYKIQSGRGNFRGKVGYERPLKFAMPIFN